MTKLEQLAEDFLVELANLTTKEGIPLYIPSESVKGEFETIFDVIEQINTNPTCYLSGAISEGGIEEGS